MYYDTLRIFIFLFLRKPYQHSFYTKIE